MLYIPEIHTVFLCNTLTVIAKNSGYVSNTSVINVSHKANLEIQDQISYLKANRSILVLSDFFLASTHDVCSLLS